MCFLFIRKAWLKKKKILSECIKIQQSHNPTDWSAASGPRGNKEVGLSTVGVFPDVPILADTV